MWTQRRDPLRELLAQRTKALVDRAIGSDGRVSMQDVEGLEPLARLAEMRDRTDVQARYAVPLVLVGTLGLVSVLVFVPVRRTEVELDLSVSEVSFVLPVDHPLTEPLAVSALGVAGLTAIDLPRSVTRPAQTHREQDLFLSPVTLGDRRGTVTVAPITIPAGTRVAVRTGQQQEYRLTFRTRAPLEVAVDGPVDVLMPGTGRADHDFAVPRQVLLWPGTELVDVVFTAVAVSPTVFAASLPADSLRVSRIDEYRNGAGTVVRQLSTVLSGTVYLESIDGRSVELRRGEGLRFATSTGVVRQLALGDNDLDLRFHGHVTGMTSGSGDVRRSMMPTLLEWLRARHGLSLLWGTAAYVFGIALGALRWWRSPR